MQKTCSQCGKQNPADASRCWCGAALPDLKHEAPQESQAEWQIVRDGMICTRCLDKVLPVVAEKGSIAIEVILWLFMLLPGLLYSVWRRTNRSKVCPSCASPDLVPYQSERAKEILGELKWHDLIESQKKIRSEVAVGGWEI